MGVQAQIVAPKGIKIGKVQSGTFVITIDSLTQFSTDQYKIWKGSTLLKPYTGDGIERLAISDTVSMLSKYARKQSPTFTGTVSGISAAMVGAPTGNGLSSGTNTGDNSVNTRYSGLVSFPGFGITGTTAAAGNDARLSDARVSDIAPSTSGKVMTSNGTVWTSAAIPTLNQSTTGSAATLTIPRTIYGNNFDGSSNLSQIIASTYGGTGVNNLTKTITLGGNLITSGAFTTTLITTNTTAITLPTSGTLSTLANTSQIVHDSISSGVEVAVIIGADSVRLNTTNHKLFIYRGDSLFTFNPSTRAHK